jgi:hypothetical protein
VYPYISAATPHWKFDKAVTEMLYGKPQSEVTITIKTPEGKECEITMLRNYNTTGAKEVMIESNRALPINIRIN